ncbi:hypothetical protein NPM06_32400, partial [Bacillus cereus]|nr:hypothetical protein [Bacillus cereus]
KPLFYANFFRTKFLLNSVLLFCSKHIDLFLEMLTEDNAVMKFISKNKDLSTRELLIKLFYLFPTIGYGDTQYIELINKIKKKATPKI